jgi:hypothetical protein
MGSSRSVWGKPAGFGPGRVVQQGHAPGPRSRKSEPDRGAQDAEGREVVGVAAGHDLVEQIGEPAGAASRVNA